MAKEFDAQKWYQKLDRIPAIRLVNSWHTYSGAGKFGCSSVQLQYLQEVHEAFPGYCTYSTRKSEFGPRRVEIPVPSEQVEMCHSGAQGFERLYKVKKTSTFEEHPKWRPLCIFWDYGHTYIDGRCYGSYDNGQVVLESWDEIHNALSEYGDQVLCIYRHPRQY